MGTFRRVVTGHRADGKSIVASDGFVKSSEIPGLGGIELGTLWGSDEVFHYPDEGREPPRSSWFPPVGGVRLIEFVLPAHCDPEQGGGSTEGLDAAERLAPGLLSHFTDEAPGMHRSASCDMLYILCGRCVLELDDGSATALAAGDVVIQSGTLHRWKNPHGEPCRVIGAIVGAHLKK
ncbi:MAG TPA: cupin domain-containing protein [Gammaproteobacteria bacterium]|nr:cupin domain-containing protein [Gammaproteobacteria bacterium]